MHRIHLEKCNRKLISVVYTRNIVYITVAKSIMDHNCDIYSLHYWHPFYFALGDDDDDDDDDYYWPSLISTQQCFSYNPDTDLVAFVNVSLPKSKGVRSMAWKGCPAINFAYPMDHLCPLFLPE